MESSPFHGDLDRPPAPPLLCGRNPERRTVANFSDLVFFPCHEGLPRGLRLRRQGGGLVLPQMDLPAPLPHGHRPLLHLALPHHLAGRPFSPGVPPRGAQPPSCRAAAGRLRRRFRPVAKLLSSSIGTVCSLGKHIDPWPDLMEWRCCCCRKAKMSGWRGF